MQGEGARILRGVLRLQDRCLRAPEVEEVIGEATPPVLELEGVSVGVEEEIVTGIGIGIGRGMIEILEGTDAHHLREGLEIHRPQDEPRRLRVVGELRHLSDAGGTLPHIAEVGGTARGRDRDRLHRQEGDGR